MSNHFVFDVETMDLESTGIILNAAIVYFDLELDSIQDESPDVFFQRLLDRTLFVKFDSKDQHRMGRTVSKSCLDWWATQDAAVRKFSLAPSDQDVSAAEGVQLIKDYIATHGDADSFVWIRGTLDQLVLDSLCRKLGFDGTADFAHYNRWCDIRTMLRLCKDTTSRRGYCKIPKFNLDLVAKHNPIHDVCYDALQILRGE